MNLRNPMKHWAVQATLILISKYCPHRTIFAYLPSGNTCLPSNDQTRSGISSTKSCYGL